MTLFILSVRNAGDPHRRLLQCYWHLSRTLATKTGITNDWLKSQGLISVRDFWLRAHGYA